METEIRTKISALTATTVTLVPVDGEDAKSRGLADKITQVTLTFGSARDAGVFSEVGREFDLRFRRR